MTQPTEHRLRDRLRDRRRPSRLGLEADLASCISDPSFDARKPVTDPACAMDVVRSAIDTGDSELNDILDNIETSAARAVRNALARAHVPDADPAWAICAALAVTERLLARITYEATKLRGEIPASIHESLTLISSGALGERLVSGIRERVAADIRAAVDAQIPLIESRIARTERCAHRAGAIRWTTIGMLAGVAASAGAWWTVHGLPGARGTLFFRIMDMLTGMSVSTLILPVGIALAVSTWFALSND